MRHAAEPIDGHYCDNNHRCDSSRLDVSGVIRIAGTHGEWINRQVGIGSVRFDLRADLWDGSGRCAAIVRQCRANMHQQTVHVLARVISEIDRRVRILVHRAVVGERQRVVVVIATPIVRRILECLQMAVD